MVDIEREKISYEECQDEYGKKQGVIIRKTCQSLKPFENY